MSLSSLIVQREIASIREIEEALARQVLYGGDFVTNLFEVSRIEESALVPVVAESYGLPPAPPGELPKVPELAVRLVAAEVAMEKGLAPLEVGASLVVAVAEPLSHEAEQELTFALALPIEQRIAPLFRIRQALARDYGVPLDKRTARLITKIIHKGPRIASTFPPPFESKPAMRIPPRPPSIAPPPPPQPEAPPAKPAADGTFVRKMDAPPARPVKRRRGPLTMDLAVGELEASAERDVIFDVLFEFARQFFDYTALFTVHGEIAEGRDAFGDGASRDKVARIGVPLDLANILSTSRAQKKRLRSKPSREGLDAILMADLGRDGTTECVVFPIVVRTRVVALLLGDGGATGVDDDGVRQVDALVHSAVSAFERVIVRRKLKGGAEPAASDAGASRPKAMAESLPPPTQVSAVPVAETPAYPPRSDRPTSEELAPPIRELMSEPPSRPMTIREPTPQARFNMDPLTVQSDRPPPPNLLAVRRPTGAPIPREEPETSIPLIMPIGTSPRGTPPPSRKTPPRGGVSARPKAPPGSPSASASPSGGPPRTKSTSLKRAEAPALEFGVPSMPSVITESTFGIDATERQLIAQIQGETGEPIPTSPHTMRDGGGGGGWSGEPSQVHPWGRDPSTATDVRVSSEASSAAEWSPTYEDAGQHSPNASSAPPNRVAPPTDMSPQPLFPASPRPSAPVTDASPLPPAQLDSVRNGERPASTPRSNTVVASQTPPGAVVENAEPVSPLVIVTPDREMKPVGQIGPVSAEPVSPLVVLTSDRESDPGESPDPDKTPVVPPVFDPDMDATPVASVVDPVLVLSQRKGAPPFVPSIPEPKPMPVSEQQVSVPAHRPPSSRSDHSRVLPSVIVDMSSEYVALVDRVLAGPDEEAETDLLRAGGYAMSAIMAKFPGPILIESERLVDGPLPRVAECGPVIRLVASQRRTALPFVLAHVESPDDDRRFWATYLLTELVYPDAIDAAIGRAFDESPRVRHAAKAAVRALAEAHPSPVVDRLAAVASAGGEPWNRRVQAIEALGETREPGAVNVLLSLLEDPTNDVAVAARHALVTVTRQDFGLDGEKWSAWWEANKARHRLEWLIDSLMHEHRALRGAASDELRTITKEYFAYYDDLPKRERERAQARYREWWENIGRVRFSRASTRGA